MQECQTVCRDMIAAKMVHLEKYAVMPNHVHLLLLIQGDGRLVGNRRARIARPYGFQHRPTMKELRNQTPPSPHLAKILP